MPCTRTVTVIVIPYTRGWYGIYCQSPCSPRGHGMTMFMPTIYDNASDHNHSNYSSSMVTV